MSEALANARHEAVVRAIALGESHRDAYMAAYPKTKPAAADASVARLLGDARVAARLTELKAEHRVQAAEKAGVDLDWLLEQGKTIMRDALAAKAFGAASQTLERLAKIAGHMEGGAALENGVQRVYSSRPLSEDEWRSQHAPASKRPRGRSR